MICVRLTTGVESTGMLNQHSFHLFQLREQMLTKMSTALLDSPSNTTHEVEVTARAVAGLTQRPDELSATAQVQYNRSAWRNISNYMLHFKKSTNVCCKKMQCKLATQQKHL